MTDKKFWNDEPVLKEWNDEIDKMEQVVELNVEETKNTSYNLPTNMEWYTIDPLKESDWDMLTEFIRDHYVADNRDWMMYHSKQFLKKALMLPNHKDSWLLSILYNKKMIGFIAGNLISVKITESESDGKQEDSNEIDKEIVQVDFLCVHKKYRSKRMAPVLIRELTRRIIKRGIFQAIYTSATQMSLPISQSKFYMKYLDISGLVKHEFLNISQEKKIKELKLKYSTKNVNQLNWKRCEESDIPALKNGFDKHYKNMKIKMNWTDDLLKYWFLDQDKVIHSYLLKNDKDEVTDFISFFSTNYRKIDVENNFIPVAYIFHHFGETMSTESRLNQISYLAKKSGHYLIISWEIVGTKKEEFVSNRFIETTQNLNLYMYNWKMKPFPSSQVGLILF